MVHGGSCGGDRMRDMLISRLPILTWLPRYRRTDLLYDAVSGITVALTLMPQAIAYASLAGLDPLVSGPIRKRPPPNYRTLPPNKRPGHPIDPNDKGEWKTPEHRRRFVYDTGSQLEVRGPSVVVRGLVSSGQ